MSFLNTYKHLLPRGLAWSITNTAKSLRKLFEGLSLQFVVTFYDSIWTSIFPQTTSYLDEWEEAFGLPDRGLTTQQRRDRLDARWAETGAQDPRYIEDMLQDAGFSVYVHEWWVPGTEVNECATPRDPTGYILGEPVLQVVACGEPVALAGETFVQCGETFSVGSRSAPTGYLLVNKVYARGINEVILAGEALAQCGEPTALCGSRYLVSVERNYPITFDKSKWSYMLYIGGLTFGTVANVPSAGQDELEELCLRIRPLQQWLVMLINYT